ncbi:MAG: phosphatidylserine decarboxylase family protein [Desulfobacterota bacterium]|nr:phosphatidylserine decarboxylase family protein [Thermodesulfobacteriota bacterium]
MVSNRWPIAREGLPFLIPSLLLTLLLLGLGWTGGGLLGLLVTLFIAYFFRNPKRKIPNLKNIVLSPADGKVVEVGACNEDRFLKEKALKISIFMSPFDVHLNRAPISGKVVQVAYQPGKFSAANRSKASIFNERNALMIEAEGRFRVLLVQIAGFIARRIVCYAKPGDHLNQGEIFGMIRFGSRVDLFLPLTIQPIVRVGQHLKGGESIIGYVHAQKENAS